MDIYDLTPSFQGLEVIVSMIQMLKQGYERVISATQWVAILYP